MKKVNSLKNILVVNVNWLGDVIFSSPVFSALKAEYPQAKISCMAVPRVKDILKLIPGIDEVIVFDEAKYRFNFLALYQFVKDMRRRHFDAAFLLHGSRTRAWLVKKMLIPIRVGYDRKGRKKYLTHIVLPPDTEIHRSDFYLRVIQSVEVPVKDKTTKIIVPDQERKLIDKTLSSYGVSSKDVLAVIHLAGNWDLKRWPKENFRTIINYLQNELKMKVVVPGSENDLFYIQDALQGIEYPPIVLAGKTNLKELVALMKRANLVISSDSGPLHVAHSVGTNVIGIFGPTRPEITGPRGSGKSIILQKELNCNKSACYKLTCLNNECMKAISVEDVINAIKQIQNS